MTLSEELAKVSRFEIIDHTENGEGRVFVKYKDNMRISTSTQDQERTLKVFLTDTSEKTQATNPKYIKALYAHMLLNTAFGDNPTLNQKEILAHLAGELDNFKEDEV